MKVYLIGAGPGDAGLLTLKGRDALASADVVVYDALANDALLAHARPDAERIYVGKVAGNHALPQGEINALLIRKAREGKIVARLKGGDPYIFGRGGDNSRTRRKFAASGYCERQPQSLCRYVQKLLFFGLRIAFDYRRYGHKRQNKRFVYNTRHFKGTRG